MLEPQENLPSLNLWPRSISNPFLSCVGPSSDVEELRSAQHSGVEVRGVTHAEESQGRELARSPAPVCTVLVRVQSVNYT